MSASLYPLDTATLAKLPCGTPLIDVTTGERRVLVRFSEGLQICGVASGTVQFKVWDGRFAVDLCNDVALAALAACVVGPWMRAGGLAGVGADLARNAESAVEHALNMTASVWARARIGRLAAAAGSPA